MKKILVTGAGGAPTTNFVRSLRDAQDRYHLVGVDCNPFKISLAETDEKYLVPKATDKEYIAVLKDIIKECAVEFIHAQPWIEVSIISKNRSKLGAMVFLPDHSTVEQCTDKYKSYLKWKASNLKVPKTSLIRNEEDLRKAFDECGPNIWLRETTGAAGAGSFLTSNFILAKEWINERGGWDIFTAAEYLSKRTTTWMSIWKDGELIIAQGRERLYWEFANRSPSGVTGITGAAVSVSDPMVDKIAQDAIFAIDKKPNGIFSVDLTYDAEKIPNPTEINIGKFFTTHYFFTEAGINFPEIYVKLAYGEKIPHLKKKVNPLLPELCWVRGMDVHPILTKIDDVQHRQEELIRRKTKLGI